MTRFEAHTVRTLERLHAQEVRDWELAYRIPALINEKDEREALNYIHAIARAIKELK